MSKVLKNVVIWFSSWKKAHVVEFEGTYLFCTTAEPFFAHIFTHMAPSWENGIQYITKKTDFNKNLLNICALGFDSPWCQQRQIQPEIGISMLESGRIGQWWPLFLVVTLGALSMADHKTLEGDTYEHIIGACPHGWKNEFFFCYK